MSPKTVELHRMGWWVVWMSAVGTPTAFAEEGIPVEEVTVEAVKRAEEKGPFLPEVRGTAIYAGKKATQTLLKQIPPIHSNNYRQAFYQMPGLLVSQVNNQSIVNINYRGIGDPHESQDLLTLKDGIPIGFDRLGYSTTYYNPPLEAIERVELIRGGSALLYGPQPGPVLNYVTYGPPTDRPISASTQHTLGSYGTYSTFNRIGGTAAEQLGYLGYFYHSDSNGQRANEGFDITGGSAKVVLRQTPGSRLTWNLDLHESDSGEPGRLSLAQWQTNRRQTLRPGDHLFIKRYASSLSYERDLSEETLMTLVAYGNYFDRFSRRRTSNTSTQNNLDRRQASAGGVEGRLRHRYDAFASAHTLTAGSTFYLADLPRTQDRSATGKYPTDLGNPIFDFDYRTVYGALFAENQFKFDKLSIVPAFRLELLNQRVKENFNTGKTSSLHNIDEFSAVPLVGIGLQYKLPRNSQLFLNISQGYKPAQFDDLAPTGNNTLPATDLGEGKTWTYEAGVRGALSPWLTYDTSAFLTDYENLFGTVTVGSNTQRRNVGRALYHGFDLGGEIDLLGLVDSLRGGGVQGSTELGSRWGSLSLYGNASLLSARFTDGPQRKREPAYAPSYLVKTGIVWRWLDRGKIALLGTLVEDHFWVDDNGAGSTGLTAIPAYAVCDLTGEFALHKDIVKLFFGINNLTDEVYFSRIRSDGIEPAPERNYYAGVTIPF